MRRALGLEARLGQTRPHLGLAEAFDERQNSACQLGDDRVGAVADLISAMISSTYTLRLRARAPVPSLGVDDATAFTNSSLSPNCEAAETHVQKFRPRHY